MRKSFIVHIDSLGVLDDLNTEQCGELFRAIAAHQLGESIDLSPIVKIAFNPFKNQFDRDDIKYEKTCIARADAGSKGGKQKVANASKRKQTVANLADSVSKSDSKSKSDKDKTLDQSGIDLDSDCIEFCFDIFWKSGIRKVNKKKTKSLFSNLLKKQGSRDDQRKFTGRLITDIQKRLNSNQLGFAEMHPTTYLNGERWNDEVITNDQSNRPNQASSSNRQTPAQRTRARAEQWEAQQEADVSAMGSDAGGIRPPMEQPVRGGANGDMGEIIDGDFSRAD